MTTACSLLDAELLLDRIDAELAAELPGYMRALARGETPPAPASIARATRAVTALAHPILADRALDILRLAIPAALEVPQPTERTWETYATLMRDRDAACRARFGAPFLDTMHWLYGATGRHTADFPDPIEGWNSPDHAPFDLEAPEGVTIVRGERARTFVVVPRREVIVVVPHAVTTPAARFAVMHEFGHAFVAMKVGLVPRVVDEAAASYLSRGHEPARQRRIQLASALDAIERGAPPPAQLAKPPWALWHDPAAQAVYVEAEAIADRWLAEGTPLVDAIVAERRRVDALPRPTT